MILTKEKIGSQFRNFEEGLFGYSDNPPFIPIAKDKSLLFMGVVTPTKIQVLSVGNYDSFRPIWYDLYDNPDKWEGYPYKIFNFIQFGSKRK